MKMIIALFLSSILLLIFACSPVKTPITNQYQLTSYCMKQAGLHPCKFTLLVSTPEAVAAYQTEQMFYINKPFQINAFAYHAWFTPPAAMIYPLLIKSLQNTGFFYAVTSSTYNEAVDFRLDTQLFSLEQNFLKKPSEIEFSAKIVLTRIKDNQIVASQIIDEHIPCPSDDPMGGVIAANDAVLNFTTKVNDFVISHINP